MLGENKAIRALVPGDEAQLVNYLTATEPDAGLVLNFGAGRLEFNANPGRIGRQLPDRMDRMNRMNSY